MRRASSSRLRSPDADLGSCMRSIHLRVRGAVRGADGRNALAPGAHRGMGQGARPAAPDFLAWRLRIPATPTPALRSPPAHGRRLLARMRQDVEAATGYRYNSVLLNLYRDQHDSVGWHSDNERELGGDPVIASLSLGATRSFRLRHRERRPCAAKHQPDRWQPAADGGRHPAQLAACGAQGNP